MLGIIRDKVTGWIAGVIVGALIISFAFWGVSFYFGQNSDVNVAIVNDEEISLRSFQRSYINLQRQMRAMFGDELSLEEEELIRRQTLQKLVDSEIINSIVSNHRFRVSNDQVLNTIRNLEVFKDEGGFDRFKYEQAILSLGMEPAFFEQQMRMDLLAGQLQAGLSETLFVTDDELANMLRLQGQTRDITYTILNIDEQLNAINITNQEISDYYDENRASYIEPEKVKIAYIELDVKIIAEAVEADEGALREYYESNRDSYDVAEQRSVTKLFVSVEEDAGDEDKAKAETVINEALSTVLTETDFSKVIEQFSNEGKGVLQFSEHAFMTRGIMGDAIDEFLFVADEDDVSDVITTEDGFAIVKVGQIRGGSKNVFETVAEQVENDYKLAQAELQYFDMSDKLTSLAFEHPDTLDIAAEELNMSVLESELFGRENDNTDLTGNDRVIAAAFTQSLIDSGENSDAIELGENHTAVIRVERFQAARQLSLDAVREKVITDLKQQKAADYLRNEGDAIVQQLQNGSNVDSLETSLTLNWFDAEKVSRNDTNTNRSVLRTAFQSGKPEGEPIVTGYSLGSGDYAIVMVTASYEKSFDEVKEKTAEDAGLQIKRLRGTGEWRDFLKNARNRAEITVIEENI